MNYSKSIQYLESFQKFGMNFGLSRIKKLLSCLGNPHKKLKSIHVAGTNGKGSVCAVLSSILNAAGYKVGLYTSPHLVSYTERIRICEKNISESKFSKAADIVRKAVIGSNIKGLTEFELLTAIAFLLFHKEKVEIAIIETGLGGRLDATNVVTPLASIITNIELEHTQILGDTIRKIAIEKAGIIKRQIPVITQETKMEALNVITRTCHQKRTDFIDLNRDKKIIIGKIEDGAIDGLRFDLSGHFGDIRKVKTSLNGKGQINNIKAALTSLVLIGIEFPVSKDDIVRGLSKVFWPARLQYFGSSILVDSAHNPAGAKFLVNHLKILKKEAVFVIGMQKDKDFSGFMRILAPLAKAFIVTSSGSVNAKEPADIAKYIMKMNKNVFIENNITNSLVRARNIARNSLICITGSIYLAGKYLAYRKSHIADS